MRSALLLLIGAFVLVGCSSEQQVRIPDAVAMTPEAVGHFCQMTVLDHPGPKAQIHLAGFDYPLFFSQVRDALAYDRMPEEAAEVLAIYVNDMAVAESWEQPGIDNWIEITTAFYVIDSTKRGGMGAPELAPFSTHDAAAKFAAAYGGRVIGYSEIQNDMVLSPIDIDNQPPGHDDLVTGYTDRDVRG